MKYTTKEHKEDVNVIVLSQSEYDNLNNLFNEGLDKNLVQNRNYRAELKTIVLTDGYRRLECVIEIDDNKSK